MKIKDFIVIISMAGNGHGESSRARRCGLFLMLMFSLIALSSKGYSSETLELDLSPKEMTAGTETFTLQVQDLYANPVSVVTDTTFIITDTEARTDPSIITVDENVSQTSFDYKNTEADTDTITFTWESGDDRLEDTWTFDIHVIPADIEDILVQTQPDDSEPYSNLSPAPKVQIVDQYDNPVPDATVTVTLSKNSFTPASITELVTGPDGTAEFRRLAVIEPGSGYYLTFHTDGNQEESETFDVIAEHELTIDAVPSILDVDISLTVDGDPKEISTEDYKEKKTHGTHIRAEAPPIHPGDTGDYIFVEWRKDDEPFGDQDQVIEFELNADTTMTAVYEPVWPFYLRVTSTFPGSVSITSTTKHDGNADYELSGPDAYIIPGEKVHLKALHDLPDDSFTYAFERWELDGVPQEEGERDLIFELGEKHHVAHAVYQTDGGWLKVRLRPDIARKYAEWEIEKRIDDDDFPNGSAKNSHATIALPEGDYEIKFQWGNLPDDVGDTREFPVPGNKIVTIKPEGTTDISASFRHEDGGPGSEDCFIATAAYGGSMGYEVNTLRQWRDEFLLRSPVGISVVKAYYEWSPPLAAMIEHKPNVKKFTRWMLNPAVRFIDIFMGVQSYRTLNDAERE